MLFDEIDKKKLKYYFSKFGKGDFNGPHYLLKKSRNKIKIKGNNESVYDLPYYFITSSENNKIKGKIYVPKNLNFETNIEIKKEKDKTKYKEIEVEGNGYFKADYFFFIGKVENEFGKIQTKKPSKLLDENDKNYFSFLKGELADNYFFINFNKELEYKTTLSIDLELKKEKGKVVPLRKVKIKKILKKDNEELEEEKYVEILGEPI